MSTNYPGSVDTFPVHVDNTSEKVNASHVNNLQDAVNAMQTELGTNPKGTSTDVKTRISSVETSVASTNTSVSNLQTQVSNLQSSVNGMSTEILSAGNGLVKQGTTINVQGTDGNIVVTADNIDLAATAVTPATYTKVTVDKFGRVTAGVNPTLLADYGITDALTNAHKTDVAAHAEANLTQAGFLGKDDKAKLNALIASGFYANCPVGSASYNITNSTSSFYKLTFTNEVWDLGNEYDSGLSQFTTNVKGYYFFYAQYLMQGISGGPANNRFQMSFHINGNLVSRGSCIYNSTNGFMVVSASAIIKLNGLGASEKVEVYLNSYNATGTSWPTYNNSYPADCYFTGFRLPYEAK